MSEELARAFLLSAESVHFLQALTHPSFANEQRGGTDNQRLEFLGDAVLQLCASEYLFAAYPDAAEGELTRRRAQLVNSEALGSYARDAGVEDALRLGRGADTHGLRSNTGVLADAVEALIAASYLDGGLEAARATCQRILRHIEDGLGAGHHADSKSELQEAVQARGLEAPLYQLLERGGPAHEPWFDVSVSVAGQALAQARGRNKRSAEREAARLALEQLPSFLSTREAGET